MKNVLRARLFDSLKKRFYEDEVVYGEEEMNNGSLYKNASLKCGNHDRDIFQKLCFCTRRCQLKSTVTSSGQLCLHISSFYLNKLLSNPNKFVTNFASMKIHSTISLTNNLSPVKNFNSPRHVQK